VNGTPALFINGRNASGASVDAQKKIVDFQASQNQASQK
jgi:hypothetical protein